MIAGTVCSYPKFTPVPFREDDLWDGYPEETNAPYGVAKKALLVGAQAYREQYGLNTIFLLPTNLYGPRDNFDLADLPRDPGPDPQDDRVARARSSSGATGRRRASTSTSTTASRGCCSRPSATTGRSPSTSAPASRRRSGRPPRSSPRPSGFSGEIRWDTSMPNGQPRRSLDSSRAAELFGFRAQVPLRRGHSTHRGLVPRPAASRCDGLSDSSSSPSASSGS